MISGSFIDIWSPIISIRTQFSKNWLRTRLRVCSWSVHSLHVPPDVLFRVSVRDTVPDGACRPGVHKDGRGGNLRLLNDVRHTGSCRSSSTKYTRNRRLNVYARARLTSQPGVLYIQSRNSHRILRLIVNRSFRISADVSCRVISWGGNASFPFRYSPIIQFLTFQALLPCLLCTNFMHARQTFISRRTHL